MNKTYLKPMLLITLFPISVWATITAIDLVDQKAHLLLNIQMGENYEMQSSQDLFDWVPIETLSTVTSSGTWNQLISQTNAFFRLDKIDSTTNALQSADVLEVIQSWSQEQNYTRTTKVIVPTGSGPHPVLIALHGNGGNTNYVNQYTFLDQYIRIAPQGYNNSWNIDRETSKAPDVDFIRNLILQLRTYSNVDASRIVIIGSSNGAALINRLLIELNGALFQTAIKLTGQLNANQYNQNQFWYDPTGGNAYDTSIEPAQRRQILSIVGTADPVVPYSGGNGVLGYQFLDAQESLYLFAKQMGYIGSQLTESQSTQIDSEVYQYSYLDGSVMMVKLVGANHSLQPFANHFQDGRIKTILKAFLNHP
jgi:poly(3-hydroxybutyrate) depolymerase